MRIKKIEQKTRDFNITDAIVDGGTDLNEVTFNQMQDNIEEAIGDIYSTQETFTEKYWIDGKKIYRKVVPVNFGGTATTTENVPTTHNIKDIDYITFHHLSWFDMQDNSWYANNKDAIEGAQFYINLDGVSATEIKVKCIPIGYNWQDRTKNRYVTLEYTKTTE